MMTICDLDAIKEYVEDGFGSLGIVVGSPMILDDGFVGVDCDGVHPGDVEIVADRIAQAMGRRGWDVDVWHDAASKSLKIDYREHEVP